MIGHYLLTLTEEQEDRVLTSRLRGGAFITPGGRCLVSAVRDFTSYPVGVLFTQGETCSGLRYDRLVGRFGERRVNAAIRNRILSNRARRTLSGNAVGVGASPLPVGSDP